MKWVVRSFLAILGIVGLVAILAWAKNQPRPKGTPSPEADALAHKLEAAVDIEGFKRTGVLKWDHAHRHKVLWDRTRGLSRVSVDDWVALQRTSDFSGLAFEHGVEVIDHARKAKILDLGKKWFVNDSYWLYPWLGLFDAGVTRSIVPRAEGVPGLLIEYASGGVTPGDAYLWSLDGNGRPLSWNMWVKVMPIGGLEFTWDGWQTLPTGAQISTQHRLSKLTFEIEGLVTGDDVAAVEPGPDPFAPLFGK